MTSRFYNIRISILLFSMLLFFSMQLFSQRKIANEQLEIELTNNETQLWLYRIKGDSLAYPVKAPIFEIDGRSIAATASDFNSQPAKRVLINGITEYVFESKLKNVKNTSLKIVFQLSPDNAVVRYKYELSSTVAHLLTKKITGTDNLSYGSVSLAPFETVTEIQLSNYDEKLHSYILKEQPITKRYFDNNASVAGPIIVATGSNRSLLMAYEHGAAHGREYLYFDLSENREAAISAVRGNYLDGQTFPRKSPFETVWFQMAAIQGDENAMAEEYRDFMLNHISQNSASRKPYIFYNTWGRQERVNWAGKPYLSSMNLKQTLAEIERANEMGVEVFVVDTGWYVKTGDWELNTSQAFFPDSLQQVTALLEKYDMELGLWFNPTVAALSSKMLARNKQNKVTKDGKMPDPRAIWETEESVPLCLESSYWEDFSEVLIELIEKYGVSYFKWDAIGQENCDSPDHYHGTAEHSPKERLEYDGYLQPFYMSKIVDKVCAQYPESIFDFDITEDGRSVGLAFLSSGKYFAVNNGPYFHNFDLADEWGSPLANGNSNIFVNPGPSRGWFTRNVLDYDKWIPSTLFLTHYQPDEPYNSQLLNIASLILGQNGIWGEILKTTPEGTVLFHNILEKYKVVRNDITTANPVTKGAPGEAVEIHEKISKETGKGAVVLFSNGKQHITYITEAKVNRHVWHTDGVSVSYDKKGRAILEADFDGVGAKIIFFGVE